MTNIHYCSRLLKTNAYYCAMSKDKRLFVLVYGDKQLPATHYYADKTSLRFILETESKREAIAMRKAMEKAYGEAIAIREYRDGKFYNSF